MPSTGYSDRINHALAYAAKHHDRQVRRGLRTPYFTQPANVGIILTRFEQDDDTVVAGVLYDVVEDCAREQGDAAELGRLGDKFGAAVVVALLAVTQRRLDDDGIELSTAERRDDLLQRLDSADARGRWVVAATALHALGTLLADLARTDFPEAVWERQALGHAATVGWYQRLLDRLRDVGFDAPIVTELAAEVERLEQAAPNDPR